MSTTFLTVQEAAQRLRVSTRTIRRWIQQGDLPAIKIGKTVRILEKEITSLTHAHSYREEPVIDISAASDEVFAETWDNNEDAVYDNWRQIYGVHER